MRPLVPTAVLLSAALLVGCQEPESGPVFSRAMPGDTVWLLLNHVKPDQRENFERFIEEILNPAIETMAQRDSFYLNLLSGKRALYPTEANEDGTYTYVYLVERYTSGDYGYRTLLSQVYTAEETESYLQIPADALDRPQEVYLVTQSQW